MLNYFMLRTCEKYLNQKSYGMILVDGNCIPAMLPWLYAKHNVYVCKNRAYWYDSTAQCFPQYLK